MLRNSLLFIAIAAAPFAITAHAVGPSLELVEAAAPPPAWTFWDDRWTAAARAWTLGLSSAFRMADQHQTLALQDDLQTLEKTLARFNWLAQHARAPREVVDEALASTLATGAERARELAGPIVGAGETRRRDVLATLANLVDGGRSFRRLTRRAGGGWTRYGESPAVRSMLGVGVMGYGAWALNFAAPEHFVPVVLTGVGALVLARIAPPLSRRAKRRNWIRGPLARCETALISNRRPL